MCTFPSRFTLRSWCSTWQGYRRRLGRMCPIWEKRVDGSQLHRSQSNSCWKQEPYKAMRRTREVQLLLFCKPRPGHEGPPPSDEPRSQSLPASRRDPTRSFVLDVISMRSGKMVKRFHLGAGRSATLRCSRRAIAVVRLPLSVAARGQRVLIHDRLYVGRSRSSSCLTR